MKRGFGASVVLVCLICFGALAATYAANWSPKLGLDLAGGLSVVYTPVSGTASTTDLSTAAQIMNERANGLGLSQPNIVVQGNTVQVQLPGVSNANQILPVLGNTATMYFRPVLCSAPPYAGSTAPAKGKKAVAGPIFFTNKFSCPAANQFTTAGYTTGTTTSNGNYTPPAPDAALAKYQTTPQLTDSNPKKYVLLDDTGDNFYYGQRLVLGPALAEGTIIKNAAAQFQPGVGSSGWVINVTLTGPGTTTMNSIGTNYLHLPIADDLGGVLEAAPIMEGSNFNTGLQVSGNFTQTQAQNLATDLNYGSIPVRLKPLDTQIVSPSLGKSSLQAGLLAGVVGLLLVMIYMVFYYRALGVVVVLGLITTAALIFALIAALGHWFNLTLDLSGVTGLIVSVGITVDSYVVYFERLKDEIRAGRTVRASVDRGFKSAWRTVVSADVVSLLGAAVLYFLTIGAVKGFAFWLMVSTGIDLLTAYFFTRPLVIILGRNPRVTEARGIGIGRGLLVKEAVT